MPSIGEVFFRRAKNTLNFWAVWLGLAITQSEKFERLKTSLLRCPYILHTFLKFVYKVEQSILRLKESGLIAKL
jgi:hypothetical protein